MFHETTVTTCAGVLQIAISNVVQDESGGVSSDAEMDGEDEDGDGNENEDEDEDVGGCMLVYVGSWLVKRQ